MLCIVVRFINVTYIIIIIVYTIFIAITVFGTPALKNQLFYIFLETSFIFHVFIIAVCLCVAKCEVTDMELAVNWMVNWGQ